MLKGTYEWGWRMLNLLCFRANQWRCRGRCDSIQFLVDRRIYVAGYGLYGSGLLHSQYKVSHFRHWILGHYSEFLSSFLFFFLIHFCLLAAFLLFFPFFSIFKNRDILSFHVKMDLKKGDEVFESKKAVLFSTGFSDPILIYFEHPVQVCSIACEKCSIIGFKSW